MRWVFKCYMWSYSTFFTFNLQKYQLCLCAWCIQVPPLRASNLPVLSTVTCVDLFIYSSTLVYVEVVTCCLKPRTSIMDALWYLILSSSPHSPSGTYSVSVEWERETTFRQKLSTKCSYTFKYTHTKQWWFPYFTNSIITVQNIISTHV